MKSAKCFQCGFVGWEGVEFCKKCGAAMTSASADGANQRQQSYGSDRPGFRGGSQAKLKTGLAVGSLVVGIVSCFTFGGLLGIGATVGIILGIVAMVKANRYPSEYGGKGLATAGMVSSVLSVVIIFPIGIIAAIAIPNLLAAGRAANEGSSIAVIRKISAAESNYQADHGKYGDLNALALDHLIDPGLASSPHNGYRFTISEHSDPAAFEATGVPVSYPMSGIRSFYIDETGVIRAADRHGAQATRLDSPLGDSSSGSPYRRASDERSSDRDDR